MINQLLPSSIKSLARGIPVTNDPEKRRPDNHAFRVAAIYRVGYRRKVRRERLIKLLMDRVVGFDPARAKHLVGLWMTTEDFKRAFDPNHWCPADIREW